MVNNEKTNKDDSMGFIIMDLQDFVRFIHLPILLVNSMFRQTDHKLPKPRIINQKKGL
jgi:hypothetical protein